MIITLLIENYELETPSQENLNQWADEYGQTFPVLSDGDDVALRFTARGSLSLPSHSLFGPGSEVLIADGIVSEDNILNALP